MPIATFSEFSDTAARISPANRKDRRISVAISRLAAHTRLPAVTCCTAHVNLIEQPAVIYAVYVEDVLPA